MNNLYDTVGEMVLRISNMSVVQDTDNLVVDAAISYLTTILNREEEIFKSDILGEKPRNSEIKKFKLGFGDVLLELCNFVRITTSASNDNDVFKSKICSVVILLMQNKTYVGFNIDFYTRAILCSHMMEWNSIFGLVIMF
jgi:hypothetical protein